MSDFERAQLEARRQVAAAEATDEESEEEATFDRAALEKLVREAKDSVLDSWLQRDGLDVSGTRAEQEKRYVDCHEAREEGLTNAPPSRRPRVDE